MRFYRSLRGIPENAVFWLLLFSLAVGSASSLYQKAADKAAAGRVEPEYYTAVQAEADYDPAAPAANSQSVASIKSYLTLELPYPCQIFPATPTIR